MVNALRAGTIVAVVAGARRLVHGAAPPDLRRPHACRRGVPGRGGARSWLGLSASARLLRRRHRRRRSSSPRAPVDRRPGQAAGVGGDRHRAGVRAGLRRPVREPLRRFLNGLTGLLFGSFLGISDGQVLALLVVGRRRARGARAHRRGRCSSRPSTPTSPPPAACRSGCSSSSSSSCSAAPRPRSARSPGALLVFALLVMPAATAQQLTAAPGCRPGLTVVARSASPCGSAWRVAYFSIYPVGFFITTFGFAGYLLRRGWQIAAALGPARPPDGDRMVPASTGPRRHRPHARPAVPARTRSSPARAIAAGGRAGRATSSCSAARSSPATRSATSRSPARSPRWRSGRPALGLFGACLASRWRMAVLGRRGRGRRRRHRQRVRLDPRPRRALPDDLHDVRASGADGTAGVNVLFGSIFGLSASQAVIDRRRRGRRLPWP